MSRFLFCIALLLCAASPLAAAEEAQPNAPLRQGDAILVHIEGVGGGLPEYREIVDSDGNIETPFLGFLSADGKFIADVESEMAAAYAKANLSTGAVVHITYVTHFDPPPARQTLLRSQDPRRPVSAAAPLPSEK
jgi:protein involved in polysaccharide export with SLBB domain